ncbi:HlyD family type I secretion periplasmic adaptor subunit [Litorisediminicola beolgyonensis]|uniref:Membrane fusion protein (MFP) family protein n=1 Tax=Litorisediminicola beolgyonensis TaxID=1173614 RepID=A0ABW3ZP13_9RHOB
MTPIPTEGWSADVPRSILRLSITAVLLMALSFGGFGAWALTAPLAAAVISQGTFVATGRNKIVQHLEGGIIRDIRVSEGDRVMAGDPLIELDRTAAQADQRELWLRQLRLEAIAARLLAEYRNEDTVTFPPSLDAAREEAELADIFDKQRLAFQVSRSVLETDLSILDSSLASLTLRADGYSGQLAALEARAENLAEELAAKEALAEKGLVKAAETGLLRRALLESEGQIARLVSQLAELEEERTRFDRRRAKLMSDRRQAVVEDLQSIQAELDSIREQTRKADAILTRAAITAPVSGTVVRLHYHSVGGVIETGKPIVEILPTDAPLQVEIKVLRTDIDSVSTGQHATVRLTAMNQRTTPVLNGTVSYVSADSITDTSEGIAQEIYVANIDLPPEEMQRVAHLHLLPGMPAEAMVQTETRTFFDYLAKPVRDSMSRAFKEQ